MRPSASLLFAAALTAALPSLLHAQGFASAVAAGDNEMFVAEPLNPYAKGVVHVYRPDRQGQWQRADRLLAADGSLLDRFGRTMSRSGNRLLIGATSIDSSVGAAYIFERDRSGAWRQAAKLVPAGAKAGDSWGRQVLLDGDMAYVSSWGANELTGVIAVWRRGGDGRWTEAGTIRPADAAAGDLFSSAIAASGDLLLTSTAQRDTARGAAFIFRRGRDGRWTEEARLRSDSLPRFASFGQALALRDDIALVGAPGLNEGTGAVIVYGRDAAGAWSERMRITAPDGAERPGFGAALGFVGPELWIGAPGTDDRRGRIYRMVPTEGGWRSVGTLEARSGDPGDAFGAVFTIAGNQGVVGLPGDDLGMGTVAFLTRAGGGWSVSPRTWTDVEGPRAVTGGRRACAAGAAEGYPCSDVDLLSYLPVSDIGGGRGVRLNDIWGWTDPQTGREYALVGRMDGTSFVDVTDPERPRYLGDLPMTAGAQANAWRDIKVYRDHAFIVADGAGQHGMQVFDLTRLRNPRGAPATFTADTVYDRFASAHNIVIDTAAGFAFAVGANSGGEVCGGALHMVDIRQPRTPAFAGCFADPATGQARTGYTHDAQCVVYHGPDAEYQGRQICFNASETALGIADVTDKQNPRAISRAGYPNVQYAHQGWLSEDHRWFYMDDEGDESAGVVAGTRTVIWDVSDLDDPVPAAEYVSPNKATDHNLYVKGHLMYQSNYESGLRILDISDPTRPRPAGFFDTVPVGEDTPNMDGSWSNYPYFRSGTIVVTSMREGLFVLRRSDRPLVP